MGDVIKFGESTRLYALEGPEELRPAEYESDNLVSGVLASLGGSPEAPEYGRNSHRSGRSPVEVIVARLNQIPPPHANFPMKRMDRLL